MTETCLLYTSPSETAVNGLWKKFVNQQARVMNILSNLAYSPDRQSTKTNAIYSIRQSSIQTMYNIMDEENFTAWGTEMILSLIHISPRSSCSNRPR